MTDAKWRPISTAPQDRTPVDIWSNTYPPGCRITDVQRVSPSSNVYEDVWRTPRHQYEQATHWAPIPKKPDIGKTG